MPELPEVETIARELRPLVQGATITDVWFDWPRAIRHPDPDRFAADLPGRRILDVGRRAKWVLVELTEDGVLAIQVKMTGQLFVVSSDEPRDRHVHVAFALDDGRELRFRDIRKFGRVGLYRRAETGLLLGADEATELFAEHGPEPLADAFTLARFRERLRSRRGRLKPLLLDQSFVAGVGNIYADEALWLARLHPLRRASALRPDEESRLYRALREVLAEAVRRRGSSIDDYRAPEGEGEMQGYLKVYGRAGLPCPRCARPIRRITLGARGTHFCSWCQRLRSDDRVAARSVLATAVSRRRAPTRAWTELPGPDAVGTATLRPTSARRVAERG